MVLMPGSPTKATSTTLFSGQVQSNAIYAIRMGAVGTGGRNIFNPAIKGFLSSVATSSSMVPQHVTAPRRRRITYYPLQREAGRLQEEIRLKSFKMANGWDAYGSDKDASGRRTSRRLMSRRR